MTEAYKKFHIKHPNYNREYYKTHKDYWKKWHELFPHARYAAQLKFDHGITLDQYMEIYAVQQGGCRICGATEIENKERLHVDHCHKTGKIRGLLCKHCNHGLGMFRDNPEYCISAAEYLRKYG